MTATNPRRKERLLKHREIWICLFLVTATLSVYWQVRHHSFVNYDDTIYVTENRRVEKGITLDGIKWAFTSVHGANWHPLTWMSHMLDCQLYGTNPGRHHLTNLFLHLANTLLLFFVFRKMTGGLWQSGFVAALFALHPLHVESVAWISERKDVLSTFFGMLTIWSYIRHVDRPTVHRYFWIVLLFILGLMSKPMLVTLPFVLLLLDVYPLRRFQFRYFDGGSGYGQKSTALRLLWEKAPLFVLSAISILVTFYVQKHGAAVRSLDAVSLKHRIANALVSYVKYIGKTLYPSKLAVLYPYPKVYPWWEIAGACLLLAGISFFAFRTIKQSPYFTLGWLWYVGTLVPVIGLIQVGIQSMADRYTYIPLIGLFIIIAWGVPELMGQWRHKKICLAAMGSICLAILITLTWKQAGYWKNSITLFEHTLKVTSNNHLSHNNLGLALYKEGRRQEAVLHFLHALRINPHYETAHNNLGLAFFEQGHTKEAVSQFLQALRTNPDYADAHNNLGLALYRQGNVNDAIDHFLKALRIKPDEKVYNNMGLAMESQGRIDEAVRHYLKALQINPDYIAAHNNLGIALLQKGSIEEAIACFQEALRIKPDYVHAKNNLKKALMMQQWKQ